MPSPSLELRNIGDGLRLFGDSALLDSALVCRFDDSSRNLKTTYMRLLTTESPRAGTGILRYLPGMHNFREFIIVADLSPGMIGFWRIEG
jgi:hypothetical protein